MFNEDCYVPFYTRWRGNCRNGTWIEKGYSPVSSRGEKGFVGSEAEGFLMMPNNKWGPVGIHPGCSNIIKNVRAGDVIIGAGGSHYFIAMEDACSIGPEGFLVMEKGIRQPARIVFAKPLHLTQSVNFQRTIVINLPKWSRLCSTIRNSDYRFVEERVGMINLKDGSHIRVEDWHDLAGETLNLLERHEDADAANIPSMLEVKLSTRERFRSLPILGMLTNNKQLQRAEASAARINEKMVDVDQSIKCFSQIIDEMQDRVMQLHNHHRQLWEQKDRYLSGVDEPDGSDFAQWFQDLPPEPTLQSTWSYVMTGPEEFFRKSTGATSKEIVELICSRQYLRDRLKTIGGDYYWSEKHGRSYALMLARRGDSVMKIWEEVPEIALAVHAELNRVEKPKFSKALGL